MKSNQKGFTLIELLAVIVILAISALIATPIILNIVSKARKSAAADSVYGIMKAMELKYVESMLDTNMLEFPIVADYTSNKFTYGDSDTNTYTLTYKGTTPTSGKITLTDVETTETGTVENYHYEFDKVMMNGYECKIDAKQVVKCDNPTAE